jgi:E3 ubiquitin-protein ligase HUWE1
MKVPCAIAVQEMQLIDQLVALLQHSEKSFSQTHTPKWLAPLLLLLDLFEKVAISTERKEIMHKVNG